MVHADQCLRIRSSSTRSTSFSELHLKKVTEPIRPRLRLSPRCAPSRGEDVGSRADVQRRGITGRRPEQVDVIPGWVDLGRVAGRVVLARADDGGLRRLPLACAGRTSKPVSAAAPAGSIPVRLRHHPRSLQGAAGHTVPWCSAAKSVSVRLPAAWRQVLPSQPAPPPGRGVWPAGPRAPGPERRTRLRCE
jgi:hypothetical protein